MRIAAAALLFFFVGCAPRELEDAESQAEIAAVPEAPAPAAGDVKFGRDMSERITGVRIRDQKHVKPRVVFSVRLPNVSSAESLKVRGEVTLSRCNPKDIAGQSGDAATTP